MTESTQPDVPDEQLPEDLQPSEDNPLAQPLDPDDERTKSQDELDMDATQEDMSSGTEEQPTPSDTNSQESAGTTPRPPADE